MTKHVSDAVSAEAAPGAATHDSPRRGQNWVVVGLSFLTGKTEMTTVPPSQSCSWEEWSQAGGQARGQQPLLTVLPRFLPPLPFHGCNHTLGLTSLFAFCI